MNKQIREELRLALERIQEFNRDCEDAEFTDTGTAWEVLAQAHDAIEHLFTPTHEKHCARIAVVKISGRDTVKTVAAYLPGNYRVLGMQGDDVIVGGVDNHGWTLDAYVIPRLGSGMMRCEEVVLDLEHILEYDPLNLLGETS